MEHEGTLKALAPVSGAITATTRDAGFVIESAEVEKLFDHDDVSPVDVQVTLTTDNKTGSIERSFEILEVNGELFEKIEVMAKADSSGRIPVPANRRLRLRIHRRHVSTTAALLEG